MQMISSVPSPHRRPFIAESLNRDLTKISAWCKLSCMKMIPTKSQCMTVSRSITAFLPHPDLFIDDVQLTLCDAFNLLSITSGRPNHSRTVTLFSAISGHYIYDSFDTIIYLFWILLFIIFFF